MLQHDIFRSNSPLKLEARESVITVSDLCCAAEEIKIRKKLESMSGIRALRFNLVSHRLTVEHSVEEGTILSALKDIGLPGFVQGRSSNPVKEGYSKDLAIAFALSGTLLGLGGILTFFDTSPLILKIFFSAAIVMGGWQVVVKAFRSVRNLSLDINFLMTIAVLGAVGIGKFGEGAAVIVLYLLSLLLESMSVEKTRRAIHSLFRLSPPTAAVKRNSAEVSVPVDDVLVGEVVVIRPGERVPLDGEVVVGSSTVDQSPITGESIPVPKQPGDQLFAGSFNRRGALEVRVTKLAADSTIAHIIHLVEDAQAQRATHQTFLEGFARYYTPAIFLLALVVASVPPLFLHQAFSEWFYRGLVLLVISCPCALLISTPVTIVSALTNAARNGLLIKGGKHLEQLASVEAIALDKTGTLTEGTLSVTEVVCFNSLPQEEILRIAAAVELRSEHPLAEAFARRVEEDELDLDDVVIDQFEAIHGKGARATVNQKKYVLGNHQLTEEMNVCSSAVEEELARLERAGQTVVVLSDERQVLGVIAVSDVTRVESKSAVQALHALGIRSVTLLTGDNKTNAVLLASELTMDEVKAELMPEQKVTAIQELKSRFRSVGMIGDGINDAPALAAADVSIAMGGAGSDTAIQAADIVLMSDNLSKVPYGIALGRKALRIIKQNIVFALGIKALFLTLGLFGITSLWFAILADDGATLLVVLNGMRLLRTAHNPGIHR